MRIQSRHVLNEKGYGKLIKRLEQLKENSWNNQWEKLSEPEGFEWFRQLSLKNEFLRKHDAQILDEISCSEFVKNETERAVLYNTYKSSWW
jgi:hypothetical protein